MGVLPGPSRLGLTHPQTDRRPAAGPSPCSHRHLPGGAGIAGRAEDFAGRFARIIERPHLPPALARVAPIVPDQKLDAASGVPMRRFLALALGLRPQPRRPEDCLRYHDSPFRSRSPPPGEPRDRRAERSLNGIAVRPPGCAWSCRTDSFSATLECQGVLADPRGLDGPPGGDGRGGSTPQTGAPSRSRSRPPFAFVLSRRSRRR